MRDRHEPGREASPRRVESRRLPPGGEEDVPSELFRRLPRSQQTHAEREHGPAEPRVEGADGIVVTGEESFHQLLLLPGEERAFVPSVHSGSSRYTEPWATGACSALPRCSHGCAGTGTARPTPRTARTARGRLAHHRKTTAAQERRRDREVEDRPVAGGVLVVSAFLSVLVPAASAQPSPDTVIRLSLEGVVDPFVADYLRNGIEGAEELPPCSSRSIRRGSQLRDERDHQGDRGVDDAGDLLRVARRREGRIGRSLHPDGLSRRRHGAGHQCGRLHARRDRRGDARPEGRGGRGSDDAEARRATRTQRGALRDVRHGVEEHRGAGSTGTSST